MPGCSSGSSGARCLFQGRIHAHSCSMLTVLFCQQRRAYRPPLGVWSVSGDCNGLRVDLRDCSCSLNSIFARRPCHRVAGVKRVGCEQTQAILPSSECSANQLQLFHRAVGDVLDRGLRVVDLRLGLGIVRLRGGIVLLAFLGRHVVDRQSHEVSAKSHDDRPFQEKRLLVSQPGH